MINPLFTVDELCKLARCGGGFTFGVTYQSPADLEKLAKAANEGKAYVTIQGTMLLSVDQLCTIAAAGGGYVIFAG